MAAIDAESTQQHAWTKQVRVLWIMATSPEVCEGGWARRYARGNGPVKAPSRQEACHARAARPSGNRGCGRRFPPPIGPVQEPPVQDEAARESRDRQHRRAEGTGDPIGEPASRRT